MEVAIGVGDQPAASVLTVAPTISGRSISFFSPVDATAEVGTTVRIVLALGAGIKAGNLPGYMELTVTLGDSIAGKAVPVRVGQYLSISPAKAVRNATVTVSGGGFTPGTSGGILIADQDKEDDDNSPGATGGTYTVDSSGKLTGSFVASRNTSQGGVILIQDLGTGGDPVESQEFDQLASATPSSTEVTRGSGLPVQLYDFPTGDVTAKIVDQVVSGVDDEEKSTDPYPEDGAYTLSVPQGTTPGTKRVTITVGDEFDTFLITIVSRTLTVSPSAAVPGQAVTVSGSGFARIDNVTLTLEKTMLDRGGKIAVNTDGTFLYTGKVPFTNETGSAGTKEWKAVDQSDATGRAATSSGFTIQKRAVALSPSTANPGATVDVYGSGWGVTTRGTVNSQVTLSLVDRDGDVVGSATFGPFPVSSTGEFTGAITVPTSVPVSTISVVATDNNGGKKSDEDTDGPSLDQTGAFEGTNKSEDANLRVPTGVITVSPDTASTGTVITVTGRGFPAQTNLSELFFGTANALPVPAPATDVSGTFTVTLTVPAAPRGGSLTPGAVVIRPKWRTSKERPRSPSPGLRSVSRPLRRGRARRSASAGRASVPTPTWAKSPSAR